MKHITILSKTKQKAIAVNYLHFLNRLEIQANGFSLYFLLFTGKMFSSSLKIDKLKC